MLVNNISSRHPYPMADRKRVLIIDDAEINCQLLVETLEASYDCQYTIKTDNIIQNIVDFKPNIILLDYRMPGRSGIEVCQLIRENSQTKHIPIIFVSGEAGVDERIKAFEYGADDFVTKPFHRKELELRISARLSGREANISSELTVENLKMDLLTRQVFVDSEEVSLTPKQFEILKMLMVAGSKVVTRDQFLKDIWHNTNITPRNVDSQITYLKKKIQNFRGKIVSVPPMGYRLII